MNSSIHKYLNVLIPYVFILLLSFLLVMIQVKMHVFIAGYDANFHMNQFYDAAMQIKTGHWNYFLSFFGFGHVGRIVNAAYGPVFMYLNGALLLIAKTWMRFELIQNFILLSLSGIFFFYLTKKNHIKFNICILLSLLYMISQPVMSWVLGQEFIGIGAILFPLVLIQATQIVRYKRIHIIALGLTIAIIFQTHVLTTLLGVLVLIPFFLYTWIKSKNKIKLFKELCCSALLTLLLTGNVWGVLLNLSSNRLIPPIPQDFPTSQGAINVTGHLTDPSFILSRVDIGLLLLTAVVGLFGVIEWKRSDALFKITYLSGLFFTWLSSIYVPWRIIYQVYPQFRYQIQYPKRFLCAGIALLLLSFGMMINNYDVAIFKNVKTYQQINLIFQLILLVFLGFGLVNQTHYIHHQANIFYSHRVIDYGMFHSGHFNKRWAKRLRRSYYSYDLTSALTDAYQDTTDYLPTNRRNIQTYHNYRKDGLFSGMDRQLIRPQQHHRFHRIIKSGRMILIWYQRKSKDELLPVVRYKDTDIALNKKPLINNYVSRVGAARAFVKSGINSLVIRYNTPAWLMILMYLTIISWIGVIGYVIYKVKIFS